MADIDIDVVDGIGTDAFSREARRVYPNAIRASTVSQVVMEIIQRLGSNRLRRLRIVGHAARGVQGVGNSQTTNNANQLIQVDSRGTLQEPIVLAMLAASFAPQGFAELHGCHVAAGYAGKMLLTQLAALWRVPVHGGVADQTNRAGFEGARRTAAPAANGGVTYR